jgi:hypothetical protein
LLFPIRLDDACSRPRRPGRPPAPQLPHRDDFRAWKDHDAYQKALERVLRDLRVEKHARPRLPALHRSGAISECDFLVALALPILSC